MDILKLLLTSLLMPFVMLVALALLFGPTSLIRMSFMLAPFVIPVYWVYDVLGRVVIHKANSRAVRWFFWAGYAVSATFVMWQVLATGSDMVAELGLAAVIVAVVPTILLVSLFTMWVFALRTIVDQQSKAATTDNE